MCFQPGYVVEGFAAWITSYGRSWLQGVFQSLEIDLRGLGGEFGKQVFDGSVAQCAELRPVVVLSLFGQCIFDKVRHHTVFFQVLFVPRTVG